MHIWNALRRKEFTGVVNLPSDGLASTVHFYKDKAGSPIPMQVVVIYNVEQLALEIAKHLKGGASDGGNGDDKSNGLPIPLTRSS